MKRKTIADLNQIYETSSTGSKELYAEQRSNSMLVAGNHYSTKVSESWNRLRDLKNVSPEQKLRLTKNHIQKITKTYINNLVSSSPSVKITPRDEKSNQSRKAAELNDSVWQFGYDTLELPMEILSWASDYIDLGEAAVKVFWNPHVGEITGLNQKVDDFGQPVVDEAGQPVGDESKPQRAGRMEIEQVTPTNLGMAPGCTKFKDSPYVWIRKMMPIAEVKALVGNDEDKLKMINESKPDSSMLFDPTTTEYGTAKDQVLVIEYYFRPCGEYPEGYYYITTREGIIFEGELPYGEFPVEYVGFDRIQGSPRHRSIIKVLRPYQLEINRSASKIAEHQVTSDDKILVQNGTKLSTGMNMAGIRTIQYSGNKPEVLEGRTGAQYVDYMVGQIQEMYQAANLSEDLELKPSQGAEPMGLLFRSVKDQKKFTIYVDKFEHFLKRICKLYLKLSKEYLDEEHLIPMIGKTEMVNIAEFKNTTDIDTTIKVIPMTDDVNTMFGKWLNIQHMIQYSSAQMKPADIAQLAKGLPYGNFDEVFSDVMLDYDSANNFILAIERGEQPQPNLTDNKEYMLKKITSRQRVSDFAMLSPEIQQYYQQVAGQYEQMLADEKAALQAAENGFIPTTGPLIRTDLKAEMPNASGGTKTVSKSFPVDALAWLEKRMQDQGASVETLMGLDQSSQAGVATKFNGGQQGPSRALAPTQQPMNLEQALAPRQNTMAAQP